jgi:hypothetical protein
MATAPQPEAQASAEASPAAAQPAATAPNIKNVVFTGTYRNYHRNDVAGFPAAYADQLVAKGVAVPFRPRTTDAMVQK